MKTKKACRIERLLGSIEGDVLIDQAIRTNTLAATEIASIPLNYSRLIGRELGLQVRDLPKLLKFTNLSVEQFMHDDEILLTATEQIQIVQNALQLSSLDSFGLQLGQRLTPSTHGAMGFLANSSPNLLVALEAFQHFVPTRMSFVRLSVRPEAQSINCLIDFDVAMTPEVHSILSEMMAVIFFECAEFIVGMRLRDVSINFTHPEPSHGHLYAHYLSGAYQFSQPEFNIRIPLAICEIPNAFANHANYVVAMQQCEAILNQLNSKKYSLTYQIQKMILSRPLGEFKEEDVAAALFMSKRTLARRLQKEGIQYKEIRDKILSQQASAYLQQGQLSVDTIASLLNYHDSANFRRAFKRWFHMSPSEYRESVKLDQQGLRQGIKG